MFLRRVRLDDDAYYTAFAPTSYYEGHQVELTTGISLFRFMRGLQVGGALALSRELNRHYQVKNDVTNLNLQFTIRRGF